MSQTSDTLDSPDHRPPRRLRTWLGIGFGALLLGVYFTLELALPRGLAEFSHYPYFAHPMPFAPMRGFTFEQLARHALRLLVMGPALWLLWLGLVERAEVSAPTLPTLRRLTLAACLASLAVATGVLVFALEGRAIVDDELTYRQQAALLAEGRLADPELPVPVGEAFTIQTEVGATGKYLPGEPLVQVPGVFLGLPALGHLPLAALTLWLWFLVLRRDAGETVALWGTLLLALSPMFMLTTATALSHTTTLCAVVVAGLGVQWIRDERPLLGAVLLTSALGFGLLVRLQAIVPVGAVLGTVGLYYLVRRRRWAALGLAAVVGAAWLTLAALYIQTLTGSVTSLPWDLFEPREHYGFGPVWDNRFFVHTVGTALENLAVTAVRFNGWWLGWPLSLGLVWLWWKVGRPRKGLGLWAAVGLACVLFLVPYYSTGVSDTGPVYYFELLLPASLLGALALAASLERWPRRTALALVLHLLLASGTFLWENVSRLDRLADLIHGPPDSALATVETPAILFYEFNRTEAPTIGWVWSYFPKRWRSDRDPIVTFPYGGPQLVEMIEARFPGRHCHYYRVDPFTATPELYRCDTPEARALMARSPNRDAPALRATPTAEELGLMSLEDLKLNNLGRPYERRSSATTPPPAPLHRPVAGETSAD